MIDLLIPTSLRDKINRELEPAERIEWVGMPKRVFFTPASTGAFLFGIPWTAISLLFAWQGMDPGDGWPITFFPLFSLPFILMGFWMLGAPILAYLVGGRTVYVITDRRAITFEGGWSTTIRSYPPEKLTDIYRREKRDGSGDVIINRRAWRDSDGDRHSEELGFLRVTDAKEVERRLKALAKQGERTPSVA